MSDEQEVVTIDQSGASVTPAEDVPEPPLVERARLGIPKRKLSKPRDVREEMRRVYRAYCQGKINESEYRSLFGGLRTLLQSKIDEDKLDLAKGEGGGVKAFTGITLIGPAIEEPTDDGA